MALIPQETLKRIKDYRGCAVKSETHQEAYHASMMGLEIAIAILEQINEQTKDYSIILKKD